ncbi:hypothetical protein L6164_034761 [Bauhinia variegata]|uniref:Uncharacterized protein n=1 Tax=Bauhinia variegata TaxID=167791 RepID=A0ACB9KW33_BAUVA|nr:hypothetical protein L6164_034761 [Bauhinia variegata]
METGYQSQVFLGVHFVLFGFDPIIENKVRFKLLSGGGVDVSQYGRSCTHVIVDKIVYDDPVCVAARNDGKTLVTALWVDHSADIGMPVDPTLIMYRPLKDLNGIPGAESAIMCLTGYQRQDRDDIMTMVRLMGAVFSKPLVANKVTHLICYKFEGEKYDLARKLRTIKLVNHRWLEDCLKHWVLLPEDKYNKSGYELEMVEAEAKDSEEGEDSMQGQSGKRSINKSPLGSKIGPATTHELAKSVRVASNAFPDSTAPERLQEANQVRSTPRNENGADQVSSFDNVNDLNKRCQDPGVSRHDTSCQLPDSNVNASEPRNTNVRMPFSFQDLSIPENGNSSGQPSDVHVGTSESRMLVNDLMLTSTSESAEGLANSDAKVNHTSYCRKSARRFSLPRTPDESSGNVTCPSVSPSYELKFGNDLETSSSKIENSRDRIISPCVEGSGKENDFIHGGESISLLPQKRMTETTSTKLKSRKISPDVKSSGGRVSSINGVTQGSKLISFTNEPPETEGNISADKDGAIKPNTFSKSVSSESAKCDNTHHNSAQVSLKTGLSDSKINGMPDKAGFGMVESVHDGNEIQPQNEKKDLQCSSPSNKKFGNDESSGLTCMDLCNKVSTTLGKKSPRKKSLAKKSLGSRPKQKGSVCLNKTITQGDGVRFSSGCQETATCDAEKLPMSSRIVAVETSSERENVSKLAEKAGGRIDFMDDETEAPEDKYEYVVGMAHDTNKSEFVQHSKEVVTTTEEKSAAIYHTTKCEQRPGKAGKDGTKQQKVVCNTNVELVESTSKVNEKNIGKKRPAGRSKTKTAAPMDVSKSEMAVDGFKINNDSKDKAEMESLEKILVPACRSDTSTALTNEPDGFLEVDKENRPIDREQDKGVDKCVGNSTTKSSVWPAKINLRTRKAGLNSPIQQDNKRVKTEPVCFILSGHRPQRKEFQQIIKRLNGRVCRDSHQWSYQATHFIAPDPIRRTEKFFAAAASGRWILKMDYLTASHQEGKFLAEEPYEWHQNGLSEDGAINMEAPRKWRLLRERTGHGAFYEMRIIIYGDCIAPPLDTLKRVVKAGDGTILATSPPYTRFLDTGIDYAIVSPGMPRVDLWVQEFLKHEIPCVVADYLVEYVCKPGFSLEKHVLYGTHAWAERSYSKLQSKSEEIIEELFPPQNPDDSDTICQVCGSRGRGEVMLICGDESGSVGCGIGTHIDCCDPPLKDVPEEDWFCPKCSKSSKDSNASKKTKKRILSSSKSK